MYRRLLTVCVFAIVLCYANGADASTQEPIPKNISQSQSTVKPSDNSTLTSTKDPSLNVINQTQIVNNTKTENNATTESTPTVTETIDRKAVEQEHNTSMTIFFVLCIIAMGILLIHTMLETRCQYLPESIVVVFLGAFIGVCINFFSNDKLSNWKREEVFSPTAFFLVLLPPIIFESGYNLHKGNFFQNIGSILLFAIVGTTISALVIGTGIYILGLADVIYSLNFVESFAFGSLISAVDPVATVAIFHAIDVDPILTMLVFGESILNDAISIVLTTTVSKTPNTDTGDALVYAFKSFITMFFTSAGIGVVFALISALILKHVDLRKHPSLEFGLMLVFTYAPYVLAEGIHLSGIMAILFCGIVMSHYTHFNLSTVTQITMQQTMRTLAFIAETCVFAYLGLAIFSFNHRCELALVIWALILCLVGRACNIFPLAWFANKFREHKITKRMQFVMWFSGLRGAISYALSLHLELSSEETQRVMITTTLIIVLFTTLVFGGSTMPLLKYMQPGKKLVTNKWHKKTRTGKNKNKSISLSKTREWGHAIDSEYLTEEDDVSFSGSRLVGFAKCDVQYLRPFFVRRFTSQELNDCKTQMNDLTNKWYQAIHISGDNSDDGTIISSTNDAPSESSNNKC